MSATIFIEGLDLGRATAPPEITFHLRSASVRRRVGVAMRKRRRRALSARLVWVGCDGATIWKTRE